MRKLTLVLTKYAYLFSIFGFFGLLYFKNQDPNYLVFFSFFGFISFIWFSKYIDVEKNETLILNNNKARLNSIGIFAVPVVFSMFLVTSFLGQFLSIETKYAILVATISICFALFFIVYGYLLDKYEKDMI